MRTRGQILAAAPRVIHQATNGKTRGDEFWVGLEPHDNPDRRYPNLGVGRFYYCEAIGPMLLGNTTYAYDRWHPLGAP